MVNRGQGHPEYYLLSQSMNNFDWDIRFKFKIGFPSGNRFDLPRSKYIWMFTQFTRSTLEHYVDVGMTLIMEIRF